MLVEFNAVAKKMAAEFEQQQARFTHQGTKGQAREWTVVSEYLNVYLPPKFAMGSGLIMNINGKTSSQQDIVIYDRFNSPVLQDQNLVKAFFAEQVFATIEVKSTLETADALELMRTSEQNLRLRNYTSLDAPNDAVPFHTFGFAYRSRQRLATLRDRMEEYAQKSSIAWKPTALVILEDSAGEPGVILNVDPVHVHRVSLQPVAATVVASLSTSSSGLALLKYVLVLMAAINDVASRGFSPDFWAYAQMDEGSNQHTLEIGTKALPRLRMHQLSEIIATPLIHSDDAVLRAIYEQFSLAFEAVPVPPADSLITVYSAENEGMATDLMFHDIMRGLAQYVTGDISAADQVKLQKFLQIFRQAVASNGGIGVASQQHNLSPFPGRKH